MRHQLKQWSLLLNTTSLMLLLLSQPGEMVKISVERNAFDLQISLAPWSNLAQNMLPPDHGNQGRNAMKPAQAATTVWIAICGFYG